MIPAAEGIALQYNSVADVIDNIDSLEVGLLYIHTRAGQCKLVVYII